MFVVICWCRRKSPQKVHCNNWIHKLCLPCSFGNVYFGVWQKSSDCEVDVAVKARSISGLLRTCKSSMGILHSVCERYSVVLLLIISC